MFKKLIIFEKGCTITASSSKAVCSARCK